MGSLGADSRGGIDSFPKVELVIFERRVWKEGSVRNIPEIKKMSTGFGSAKIHVQSSKRLCCEETRQEVEEEGG